jgi:long-chain acyl-CoA synthetase
MAQTIAQMFVEKVREQPDAVAQLSKDKQGIFQPISYSGLLKNIEAFAAGLASLGAKRGDRIGLISDNRREWLASDLAIVGLGAADVPRGCDATPKEISYILSWSGCELVILENDKQLEKVLGQKDAMPLLKAAILFDPPQPGIAAAAEAAGLTLHAFQDIVARGAEEELKHPGFYLDEVQKGASGDVATIIYTSGTTGDPKGVMLSHGNFLHQTQYFPDKFGLKTGHIFLSVLPVWHSFERVVQYVILQGGASIAYSKPIGSILLADMQAIQPHWFPSVPRIWESIMDGINKSLRQMSPLLRSLFSFFIGIGESRSYFRNHLLGRVPEFTPRSRVLEIASSIIPFILLEPVWKIGDLIFFKRIKAKLGKRFLCGISGGGALPGQVDRFFDAIGILILEGYGLTETAPIIAVRERRHPVLGTVGPAIEGTEIRIVDDKGETLPPGKKGHIQVRGPQVMLGYYKRPDLTAKVMLGDGWLETGDLGILTFRGELRITGRAKDTIVLRGGENIEPVPIEEKLCESPYILQSVVLGQDERYLAALIIPKQEALTAWAEENGIAFVDYEALTQLPVVKEMIDAEVSNQISQKNGFKPFERIVKSAILPEPFQPGRELSAKLEMKRFAINEIYKKQIKALFQK